MGPVWFKIYDFAILFLILSGPVFDLMENFDQIPESLSSLLKQVSNNEAFKKFVRKLTEKMNFDKKNILNLSQEKVESLYAALKTKLSTTIYSNDMTKNFENSIWL